MAEYTVRVNAIDSYTQDMDTKAISRGTLLTAISKGYYNFSTGGSGLTDKQICLIFPSVVPTGFERKRLKAAAISCYITAKQGSASGNLPPGVTFGYGISSNPTHWGFLPGGVRGSFPGVSQNAYYSMGAEVKPFIPEQTVNVYAGCSEMPYTDATYNYSASASIQSHSTANPPFAEYTFEDVIPNVTGAYPTSGFANEKQEVTLSWSMGYMAIGVQEALTVQNAKFRYRNSGSSNYTELDYLRDRLAGWNGSPTGLTIPANSGRLPQAGGWEWQVLVQSSDGIWSAPTPWYTLVTTDSTIYATAARPRDAYVDGSENITLMWSHSISTGTYPVGADYQVSNDGGTSWTDLGHTIGYSDFLAVPGTLPAGNILWRVRGYNTDNVAGPWSNPAAIVVRAAPTAPSIFSITREARPTISWQASGQQAYQVRVKSLYDSEPTYGAEKFHKVKVWLTDGDVVIGVRVQNSFGLWSQWAEVVATIANEPAAAINLTTGIYNQGISLRWQTTGNYPQYIIYRDEEELSEVNSPEFVDYLCNGRHRYAVRGVTTEGRYTMSNVATEILSPMYGYIAQVGKWDWLTLKARRGARPTHDMTVKPIFQFQHYSGRRQPVAEMSEFEDVTHSFDFTMGYTSESSSSEKLRRMVGSPVVYKDSRGDFVTGILDSLSISRDNASDVNFTIVEVSRNEF